MISQNMGNNRNIKYLALTYHNRGSSCPKDHFSHKSKSNVYNIKEPDPLIVIDINSVLNMGVAIWTGVWCRKNVCLAALDRSSHGWLYLGGCKSWGHLDTQCLYFQKMLSMWVLRLLPVRSHSDLSRKKCFLITGRTRLIRTRLIRSST